MVGKTGHFKGSQGGCGVAIAGEAFGIESNDRSLLLWSHLIRVGFLSAHERDVLFVDFVLNGKVVDEGTKIVKEPLQVVLFLELGL